MIPAAFVLLEALPYTPNGKLDRAALPAPDMARPDLQKHYVPPQNATEQTVADVVAEILSLERVGIHDNFFELGGHSLLAIQLISRLRQIFQVELPLRSLYELPTVAQLAVSLIQRQAERLDSDALKDMLSQLDRLSDDEVQALLTSEERV